jgi:ABC-2 type transport system ATP-binding protein
MIEVQNFRKVYGAYTAVNNISFTVYRGEIFGLLGPNGAGKTSTLESLEGLRPSDGGTLRVAGVDPATEPRGCVTSLACSCSPVACPPVSPPMKR